MTEVPVKNEITLFAETNFRGQRKRFGIKADDRRKHVYIIGKTGMGKSTVLENMTIQDILAGRGVAVIDPHGEYAEKLLDFVPQSRINDVVYFSPADSDYPVAFNIMENVAADQRYFVSQGLIGVFKKIWDPELWSARMEYLLANAILALLEIPDSTLLSINRLFGEKEFRRRVVSQLTDPIVKGFWENEFAKYPEQYMREAVAAIQNKAGQFGSNPLIRNVVGQVTSSVNMRKIMDESQILIVNLAKGKVGEENSSLLGAMIVTKIYLAAMSRVDIPERERKDFYLYVDEFQNFATESFTNILSEARKYRLDLTVAHQYVAQMEEPVQHAVFGNIGTMIVFRVGAEDAELLEKEFMPEFIIQDLVNLGFKNIYTKLMIDGITSRPFSAETLPPFSPPDESHREAIIKVSRERYSTPRAVVEEKIRQFTLQSAPEPASVHFQEGRATGRELSTAAGGISNQARPERPFRGEARSDRPMYEAVCAVDGKKILIPFKPDGQRPVYCDEHMHLIKFRSQGAKGEKPSAERPKADRREALGRTISLRTLRQGLASETHQPMKKEANLAELRKVLEETMLQTPQHEVDPLASGPAGAIQAPSRGGSQSLKPGETIRFD